MVSNERIITEFEILHKFCPKLTPPVLKGEFWITEGEYDFHNHEGDFVEFFFIQIQIPVDYPKTLPKILELSNKIPQDPDWHNSIQGCCLSPDSVIFNRLGIVQLDRWFKIFVESYFANFIYKKNFNEYPEGEFSHGTQGILEGYKRMLSAPNDEAVEHYLARLLHPNYQGRNETCFCQSGKKFKFCWLIDSSSHINSLNIPKAQLVLDLNAIKEHFKRVKMSKE